MKDIEPKPIKRYDIAKTESSKPQKQYPHITVDLYALPEAKNWDVGKEYTVTFRLKMTGLSIRKTSGGMDDYGNDAQFDITGTDVKGQKENKKESKNY